MLRYLAVAALGLTLQEITGWIKIDGSSTVYPVTEAVAEEFQKQNPKAKVTVGISGTGGGFKKFVAGETDISNASRPILEVEMKKAKENKIEFIELPVAFDGLSVVVHPENDWCDALTVQELKRIWEPGSKVAKWSDIRPGWPNLPLKLFGPGTDSGTFDYFTEVIVGKLKSSRGDYTASEDDNVLVQGVSTEKGALGYFGYAYYEENKDKLKLVAVDGGNGPVRPSLETVASGAYSPLSRPIYIYVNAASAARREVEAFVRFYLTNAPTLVKEVGYIPFRKELYELCLARFEKKILGTMYKDAKPGATVEELLRGAVGGR